MKEKVAREERYKKQKPFRRGIIKTISVQLQREKEKKKKKRQTPPNPPSRPFCCTISDDPRAPSPFFPQKHTCGGGSTFCAPH
jgi:hypothetical protein